MAPHTHDRFAEAIRRAEAQDAAIRARQPLLGEDEFVALTEQIQESRPLDRFLNSFVTGHPQPAGDGTQTTPAPGRRIPERGAAAGRQGAGAGPHLHVVGGRLIDATDRFNARRRSHFNNGSAA